MFCNRIKPSHTAPFPYQAAGPPGTIILEVLLLPVRPDPGGAQVLKSASPSATHHQHLLSSNASCRSRFLCTHPRLYSSPAYRGLPAHNLLPAFFGLLLGCTPRPHTVVFQLIVPLPCFCPAVPITQGRAAHRWGYSTRALSSFLVRKRLELRAGGVLVPVRCRLPFSLSHERSYGQNQAYSQEEYRRQGSKETDCTGRCTSNVLRERPNDLRTLFEAEP